MFCISQTLKEIKAMENQNQLPPSEEQVEEALKKIEAIKNRIKEINDFKIGALDALKKLYTETDPTVVKQVADEFMEAVASSGLTIVDIGREYKNQMNEAFGDILKQIPRDKVVSVDSRNLYTAALLNLFQPAEEWTKDEDSKKEAMQHVIFINAALRAAGVRYSGCKAQWDAEDAAIKELQKKTAEQE